MWNNYRLAATRTQNNRKPPLSHGYILDLDGTLYRGQKLLPGAREAVMELRARGRRLVFLSNKPLYTRKGYVQLLHSLHIDVTEQEIIHSSSVLINHLLKEAPDAAILALAEPPFLKELEEAGFRLTTDPKKADYVIATFDRTFNYDKLNRAFQALRRGAHFYATNPDPTCPTEDGEVPDCGAIIAALEAASGRRVEKIFGKPSRYMVEAALEVLGLPPTACALVGDRLETDIRMAKEAGIIAILTLTGVAKAEDLGKSSIKPDYVIASLAELPDLDKKIWG